MSAALLDRIADLEEIIRQQRAAFAPKLPFPARWLLKPRDAALLAALYVARGTHVGAEAMILWVEGPHSLSIDVAVRGWIATLRERMKTFGVAIEVHQGKGYCLSPEGRAVVARAIGDALPEAPAAATKTEGKPHHSGWSDPEEVILKAGYERSATLAVIRADLILAGYRSRSLGALSARAGTLGLVSTRAAQLWSKPEDDIILDGYEEELTLTAIRLKLADAGFSRKRGAIQMRAIALGVSGQRVRNWTPSERAIVRAGLEAGDTHAAIVQALEAKGFSRGRTAIAKLSQSMGVRRGEAPWKPEDDARLRVMYAAKQPLIAIAAALGRSHGAVASRASKLGIYQRRRPSQTAQANAA